MKNLEFHWLILKMDETTAKKRSPCLLSWFSTKGKTGRRITLQRCFCRSRYFTVILYYGRTWRILSFSGWYWELTKRRPIMVGLPSLLILHQMYDWKMDNSSAMLLPLTILYRSIVLCKDMKNLEFQWLILKIDETAAKKWSAYFPCWFSTKGKTRRRITLQRSICRSQYFRNLEV